MSRADARKIIHVDMDAFYAPPRSVGENRQTDKIGVDSALRAARIDFLRLPSSGRVPSLEIEAGKAFQSCALAVVAVTGKAASRIIEYPSDTDFNISTDIARPLRRTF